jgi:hypothetical protein
MTLPDQVWWEVFRDEAGTKTGSVEEGGCLSDGSKPPGAFEEQPDLPYLVSFSAANQLAVPTTRSTVPRRLRSLVTRLARSGGGAAFDWNLTARPTSEARAVRPSRCAFSAPGWKPLSPNLTSKRLELGPSPVSRRFETELCPVNSHAIQVVSGHCETGRSTVQPWFVC